MSTGFGGANRDGTSVVAPGRPDRVSLAVFFCACLAIPFLQGFGMVDDGPYVLDGLLSSHAGAEIRRGFLLEGLLNDGLVLAVTDLGWRGFAAITAWTLAGYALLLVSLVAGLASRSFSLYHLLIVCFFLHIVDTLSMWISKFDPLLLSFLVLSLNRNRTASLVGGALSALCHPEIAFLSALGIFVSGDKAPFGRDALLVLVVLCAALFDVLLFHLIFPHIQSRTDFIGANRATILKSGILLGLPSLLVAIYLPIRSLLFVSSLEGAALKWDMPVLLWLAVLAVLSSVLTTDHVRVASLVLFAPVLCYLGRHDHSAPFLSRMTTRSQRSVFWVLIAARFMMPHIDGAGYRCDWLYFASHHI